VEVAGMPSSKRIAIVLLITVLIAGCGRDEEEPAGKPNGPAGRTQVSPTGAPAAPTPALEPADARDQAPYAQWFPTSEKLKEWTKTQAVRGNQGENVAQLLPEAAGLVRPYRINAAAAATYQRYARGDLQAVEVTIIEAANGQDAYGIMTVLCPGQDQIKIADVYRLAGPGQICALRGNYLGIFADRTTSQTRLTDEALEEFAGKVMFNLPGRGGAPVLVQIFQAEGLPPADTYYVYGLTSLPQDLRTQIGMDNPEALTELLKLNPQTPLAVGAFQVEDWPSRNVAWIVSYASHEQAQEVYRNYQDMLKLPTTSPLHRNTIVLAPRGRYLLGSWTADAESLVHILSEIAKHLPQ